MGPSIKIDRKSKLFEVQIRRSLWSFIRAHHHRRDRPSSPKIFENYSAQITSHGSIIHPSLSISSHQFPIPKALFEQQSQSSWKVICWAFIFSPRPSKISWKKAHAILRRWEHLFLRYVQSRRLATFTARAACNSDEKIRTIPRPRVYKPRNRVATMVRSIRKNARWEMIDTRRRFRVSKNISVESLRK